MDLVKHCGSRGLSEAQKWVTLRSSSLPPQMSPILASR